MYRGFWLGDLKGETAPDLLIDGRIILRKVGCVGVDRVNLA
jgi:hypothetical protein